MQAQAIVADPIDDSIYPAEICPGIVADSYEQSLRIWAVREMVARDVSDGTDSIDDVITMCEQHPAEARKLVAAWTRMLGYALAVAEGVWPVPADHPYLLAASHAYLAAAAA